MEAFFSEVFLLGVLLPDYKIGIVGGGAAGLISAIAAAENGCHSVAVFESNVRCGTKILMSGGSRCNVTNQSVRPENFFGGSRNFIKNVLNAFSDRSAVRFFEDLGVKLKIEASGKYFPADDKASSVLNALLKKLEELNVKIYLSAKINNITFNEGLFTLASDKETFRTEKVIVTTGGKSYPNTGSDGSGYNLVQTFHHTLNSPFPALSPVLLDEPELTGLSGVTIPARLTITLNEKKHIESENSLLFTHFGISGPAALNISREVERLKNDNIRLLINFIPQHNYESFSRFLKEGIKNYSGNNVLSSLKGLIPSSLLETLFKLSGIPSDKKYYSLSKEEIKRLSQVFTSYPLKFTGLRGFHQAEATAGGVPLDEVKYQTMESKLQKGLFLAGEILDVDGLIGGYNFQWAWATGFVAGRSAAEEN